MNLTAHLRNVDFSYIFRIKNNKTFIATKFQNYKNSIKTQSSAKLLRINL